ncbi:DinB family protein [Fimbriimonas ginsengisoli]|nr:DinB family protein [Fimbriimonas ginsengisoli]
MVTIHDHLKARFAFTRQDLEQVLGRLKDSDLPWAPREGMPTIADLLLEIANKEKETLVWVQKGVWPDEDPDAFDTQSATLHKIRSTFGLLRTATYAYIDSLSEAELEESVHSPERWWEAMRQTECPLSEVLRNIAVHEWYHTAQLVTYLWLRGDDPKHW